MAETQFRPVKRFNMRIKEKIKNNLSPEHQMSEAFITSAILALSGGFMDAYTYNGRGGVFANAETGNIVLMGQRMMEYDFHGAVKYFVSILAFALGIFAAENFRHIFRYAKKIHWRQAMLIFEIVLLAFVGIIPESLNLVANVIVAFTAALQVQTFRKVAGYSFASTMCTGNLRSGMDALSVYLRERKPDQLRQAMHYFGIILFFTLGAGAGGVLTKYYGLHMIWLSCLLLLSVCLLMSAEE